jgi:serine/threonine protein kinase/Flp pilus assembly protein TadD
MGQALLKESTKKLSHGVKARDLKLDRLSALKFLHPHLDANEEEKKRFDSEIQILSALDDPQICTIHVINETEDGQIFIDMPYYEGQTLKEKVASGQLSVENIINIAIQIAEGLAKVHEHGIAHLNLKPTNVIITEDGLAKIVDFGLTKLIKQTHPTKTSTTPDTMAYMSPEQIRGEAVDRRTDIWSLGVIFYEMVTGQLPFKGDDEQTVMDSILHKKPESIPTASGRRGAPREWEQIVNKAMAKGLDERYQDLDEMLADLRSLRKKMERRKKRQQVIRQKKIFVLAAILLLVGGGLMVAKVIFPGNGGEIPDQLPKMEAYKRYDRGLSFWFTDPTKAVAHLEQAVALDSTFIKGFRALAIAYDITGNRQKALQSARKAETLSREKDAKEYFHSLIVEFSVRKNWEQAIEYRKRYLELQPDDVDMRLKLGYDLSRRMKEFSEAIFHFNKVIELDPKNLSGLLGPTYNYLGHAYLYLGQFDKAMNALEQYQALAPNNPDPLHSIADALQLMGKYEQAIAQYAEIIQKYPNFYEAYEDLGLSYLAIGKWRQARSTFNRYLSAVPEGLLPNGHLLLARVYFIQENSPLAEHEINEALARNPQFLPAHWLRGLIALTVSGNLDTARGKLQTIEKLLASPDAHDQTACYHHLRGRILLAKDGVTEGLAALRKAEETSPRDFIYFKKELANGYLSAGFAREAMQEAKNLLAFNERDGEVLALFGLAHEREGELDEAKKYFRQAQRAWSAADADFLPLRRLQSKLGEWP